MRISEYTKSVFNAPSRLSESTLNIPRPAHYIYIYIYIYLFSFSSRQIECECRNHIFFAYFMSLRASLVPQLVKNLSAMQETPVQFLGQEDPLEKG